MTNKLTTYLFVLSGIMLLFYFTGLVTGTSDTVLLNMLLGVENWQNSPMQAKVVAVISIAGVVGAVIVSFLSRNFELAAMATFATYILNIGWDFTQVISVIMAENKVIAILIFSPIMLVYLLTIVEFWRGRD